MIDHRRWMAAIRGRLSVGPCQHRQTVEGDDGRLNAGPPCPGHMFPVEQDFRGRQELPEPWPWYEAACDLNPRHVLVWPQGRDQADAHQRALDRGDPADDPHAGRIVPEPTAAPRPKTQAS